MKRSITTLVATLVFIFVGVLQISKTYAQVYGNVSLDLFYDELSPYGYWDNDPSYGEIWYPNEGRNFRPYNTNGYWTMTEYGNTWVSGYPWGWGPFHYGRWVHTNYRGWGWIPGYEWGPAWVEWRSGNGYYGWAPMAPRIGVHVSIGLPIDVWVFAPTRHIYARDIHRHSYYDHRSRNIYNNTTIINNTYVVNNNHYYGGPSRRDMERTTGRRIEVREIRQSSRPGASQSDRRSVSIYRPDKDNSRRETTSSRTDRGSSSNASRRGAEASRNERDGSRNGNVSNGNVSNRDRSSMGSRNADNGNREMHIDRNGNVSMRNDGTTSQNQRAERNAERRTESGTQRQNQREQSNQSRRSRESEVTTRPQNNGSIEQRQAPRREPTQTAPQREQRGQSRESRSPQRANTQPVFQASNRESSNGSSSRSGNVREEGASTRSGESSGRSSRR
ncbi:hypothetical protein SAMN05660841_03584 [Sphingobacterium nematocida]|uniref:Uncharacterized protein n=1 Tax=Sphingobacterium nematocida TaxID=1513896 RepID=A0A1T5FWR9_9SPHI|nr:DUF6600 domain-containing protein [Sphingobacterium nematocida]SKC00537.1 hypothetical protein SAMN05660841_03584 [Sphingobacterium nematocida]